MQKTKLGISVGLLGAAIYFMGLFNGYLAVILLAGYVLLLEENMWLKRSAVKAISVMMVFSFLTVVIEFIPNIMSIINYLVSIFGREFYIAFIDNFVNAVLGVLNIIRDLSLLGLGVTAFNQGTITIPIVDDLINKCMG